MKEFMMYYNLETIFTLFIAFLINVSVIGTFAVFQGKGEEIDLENAGVSLTSLLGSLGTYVWAIGLLSSGQASTISGKNNFIQFKNKYS